MNKYFDTKTKHVNDNMEFFIIFNNEKLYKMMKTNDWKQHKIKIDSFFKGYNDKYMAMKFVVSIHFLENFVTDLKTVLYSQINLYEVSNITYDDYKKMKEDKEKENFNAFMEGFTHGFNEKR